MLLYTVIVDKSPLSSWLTKLEEEQDCSVGIPRARSSCGNR